MFFCFCFVDTRRWILQKRAPWRPRPSLNRHRPPRRRNLPPSQDSCPSSSPKYETPKRLFTKHRDTVRHVLLCLQNFQAADPKKASPAPPAAAEPAPAVKTKEEPKPAAKPSETTADNKAAVTAAQTGEDAPSGPKKLEKRNSIQLFFKIRVRAPQRRWGLVSARSGSARKHFFCLNFRVRSVTLQMLASKRNHSLVLQQLRSPNEARSASEGSPVQTDSPSPPSLFPASHPSLQSHHFD